MLAMSSNAINKNSRSVTDLTTGSVLKGILLFALPIFLSNILQQFYNLTDISIIGHALGDDALSSIGSVSTIYGMFNSLLFGMGSGFSVVVSRYFGANDAKGLKRAIYNTFVIALIWLLGITVTAVTTLKPLMRLLNTPERLFDQAYSYAIIVLSLIVFSFAYNVMTGILRAIGNSRASIYFLLISVTSNIAMDLLFIYVFKMGIRGAAIATIIAQCISALTSFIYIWKFVPELHFGKEDMVLKKSVIVDLFSSGFAFALMFSIVNIGTVILQSAINSFGPTTIAAHTTARKISELCMMILSTLANAMSTFSGQNHGARKYDRIMKGLKEIIIFSFAVDSALILMIYTIGNFLVKLISGSSNPEVIDTAIFYLRFDLPFYFVLSILLITRMTLQGMGAKLVPLAASIMELFLKAGTAFYLAKKLGYLGIAICEPATWTICAIYILIVFRVTIHKYLKNSAGPDEIKHEFNYDGE